MLPTIDADKYMVLGDLLNETDAITSAWIKSVTESDITLRISHLQASYQDQLVHSDWYLAYYSIIGIEINCVDCTLTLSGLWRRWPASNGCKERTFQHAIVKNELDAF